MPKVGGRRKKVHSHKQQQGQQQRLIPKTFIFKKGKCTKIYKQLSRDYRKCFYPHTAMKLEDSNKINLKSYIKAAKYYSVTHLIAFQQAQDRILLRIIKVGGGQMRFKILNYSLMSDIVQNGGQLYNPTFQQPLLVLNNFNTNQQTERIGRSFQQLFPPINVQKVKLSTMRRVVSFTYQPNKKCIYFRHYKIVVTEGGIKTDFKNLLHTKKHIDLSQYQSFSDILGQEEQVHGRENQQVVKLIQMGPRLKLRFINYYDNIGQINDGQQSQQNYQQMENQQNQQEIIGQQQ